MENHDVVLLLDGIDESIARAPWIINSIHEFISRYPRAQLICSSRISGSYLERINLFGIILLPFTDYQREQFISKWFIADSEKARNVLNHINHNPDLGDIIRNPLHATIICSLAEQNIPLPDSEVQLYEERMKLLMGKYDIYKRINRIKSRQNNLEIVAQKLAYLLHLDKSRYESITMLKRRAKESLKDKLNGEIVELAIDELIDPCNILLPMTENNQYGFGHLKFQEYLTACELCKNRGIHVGPLMYDSWWKGALLFFAKLTDDIEFLIEWLASEGNFARAYCTLNDMINVKPSIKSQELQNILLRNYELDLSYGDEEYNDKTIYDITEFSEKLLSI